MSERVYSYLVIYFIKSSWFCKFKVYNSMFLLAMNQKTPKKTNQNTPISTSKQIDTEESWKMN